MASTYTGNTGIEKIGTGEQAGTWGTTSNRNFDIIDTALNGVVSIALSGTSHTLSTTNGTVTDGMNKVLVLAGSPSGTNTITISPNDQEKLYFVSNGSGQSAVFSQGSGANVTIANGAQAIIYANGAGSGAAVAEINPSATAGGIGTAAIADDAITAAKIADDAVVTAAIADDAVVADAIADNAVGAAALNISGNGTAGQVVASDGDGSFSYSTIASGFLPGMLMPYAATTEPTGWVFCYGQSVDREGTYANLFAAIGTTYGTASSSKFNLPDLRGRVIAGKDNMGGSSANRLQSGVNGSLNGDTLGAAGGNQVHTLTTGQLASHTHGDGSYSAGQSVSGSPPGGSPPATGFGSSEGATSSPVQVGGTSGSAGSGQAHNNVQPTFILNYIIKI
jgi:microcystin-dependent protein